MGQIIEKMSSFKDMVSSYYTTYNKFHIIDVAVVLAFLVLFPYLTEPHYVGDPPNFKVMLQRMETAVNVAWVKGILQTIGVGFGFMRVYQERRKITGFLKNFESG